LLPYQDCHPARTELISCPVNNREVLSAFRINHLVEIKDSLKGEKVSRSVNQSEVGINNSTTPAASPICHIKNEIILIVCLSTKTQLSKNDRY
jgi:hypothetical protein